MPEYSIMNARWRWKPDPDFALGRRTLHRSETRGVPVTLQEASDLIDSKGIQGAKKELLQRREDVGLNDPDYRPGFIKVLEQWSEAIRGWRAVLVRIVQSGFVSLPEVQKAIRELEDPANVRASWAVKTGQQSAS
jgi:hypothetical protein